MSDAVNTDGSLRILNSIFDGYSKYNLNNGCAYLKHPLQLDVNKIYLNYKDSCAYYENQGIMSEKEQMSLICENGWWSYDKENEILFLKKSLIRLQNTKSKLIYKADKERISEQIYDIEKKILLANRQKSEYIQTTSEDLASKESTYFFIKNFIFKDSEFKNKFIENEENDYEAEPELNLIYYRYLEEFSVKNIKKVALSVVFQNMLYTAPAFSCIEVFGNPVSKLTKNQMELLIWGGYYQKLIKNSQKEIPDELYNDPEKFIEWYESVNKVKINKKSSKRPSKKSKYGSESKFLFGDRDEIKNIEGGEISGDKVLKEAEKRGGNLDFYDLMEK